MDGTAPDETPHQTAPLSALPDEEPVPVQWLLRGPARRTGSNDDALVQHVSKALRRNPRGDNSTPEFSAPLMCDAAWVSGVARARPDHPPCAATEDFMSSSLSGGW